jgi:outer membrane protein TolC
MTEFRGMPADLKNIGDTREVMFMMQQKFPFPGKLSKSGEKAKIVAETERILSESVRLKIVSAVKIAYYQIFRVDKALEINRENKTLMNQFLEIARIRYTVDNASQQDIFKAQMELSKLEQERVELEHQRKIYVANINRLLNRPSDVNFRGTSVSEDLPALNFDSAELANLLDNHQPLIHASKSKIRASEIEVERSRLQSKPDFSLMLGYTWMNEMPDAWMGRVSVNLPFAFWADDDNSARINSSIHKKSKTNADYESVRNSLIYQTNEIVFQLNSIEEQIEIYKTRLIPEAEQTLEASLSGYQTGLVDFLTLISNERTLQSFRLQYYNLISQYYQQLALLERTLGASITN